VETFNDLGVPCGPIYNIGELFDDAQVRHLGLAQPLTSPTLGEMQFVRQPVSLDRTPSSFAVAPPEVGEQTREILESLGYAPDEIDALLDSGVVASTE
jgi:crotonobetainyl-CoA:carnitine CoA-transferase CaiB-like acyl-CoA transferase